MLQVDGMMSFLVRYWKDCSMHNVLLIFLSRGPAAARWKESHSPCSSIALTKIYHLLGTCCTLSVSYIRVKTTHRRESSCFICWYITEPDTCTGNHDFLDKQITCRSTKIWRRRSRRLHLRHRDKHRSWRNTSQGASEVH